MRILVLNPNTSPGVTARIMGALAPLTPPGVTLVPATGRFGARYISSRSAAAIAGHAALDAFAEHGRECDAVYLACFGDPGLMALKEVARVPVIGMAEASCRQAAAMGRFAIVTGGERWRPMLMEFVASLGLGAQLSAVETVAPAGGDIARDPGNALGLLADACRRVTERAGADVVILGGAGLAGLAPLLQPRVDVPLMCSTQAGFHAALEAAHRPGPTHTAGDGALAPRLITDGLSSSLQALLESA